MLYFFNPGHETAILNASPYYTPPAVQLKMQSDLAYLPAWYATKDDYVWTACDIPQNYMQFIEERLGNMPVAVSSQNLKTLSRDITGETVNLWGISPHSIRVFEEINRKYDLKLGIPTWNSEYKRLSSRLEAKNCLEYLVKLLPGIAEDIIPVYHTSVESIELQIMEAPDNYIVKSPYSSSGRGLLWLSPGRMDRSSRQILQGMLNRQSAVSLEKALNKQLDFSMQFYADGKGDIIYQGLTVFETDTKGNYMGTRVGDLPDLSLYGIANLSVPEELLRAYLKSHYANLYQGHLGVDMMIYEQSGQYFLHPCVEINMRTTMGYLALQLQNRLYRKDIYGYFHIDFSNKERDTLRKHQELSEMYPLKCQDDLIVSGYLPLCPVNEDTWYHAYLLI